MKGFPAIHASFGEDPRDRSSSGAVEASTPEKMNKQMEKSLQLPVPSNKNKSTFSKDYLAKSLDWDRDFLTSEGVLDYEELASLNSTFRRIDTCSLSVIHEESKRSTATNSTLSDDDNLALALENLELHLFENKGASMRTFSTGVKASESEKSSKKNIPRRGRTLSLELPTKVEASQNKKSPEVPEQHGASNYRLQNTSRWVKVVKGYVGVTGGKTVSNPTSALSKSNLSTMPAKTTFAPGSIQIRTSDFREKPGNVAIQKAVVAFKQLHKGSSSGISKFQASKATSNSISDSSVTTHYSPSENTRMRSNFRGTNNSSSESMANKTSSSRSNTNQSFSRRNGARTVHTSANNSTIYRGSSVDLSLPTTSRSSRNNATSVSSSFCSVKPAMNRNEANSSTPSVMGVDANEIHSACTKSSFASIAQDDGYHRSHISKGSIDNHAMPIPLKGNHSKSSPGNRSEAISSKPSGHNVAHPKLANSDMKKPVNYPVGTLSQASQQPKLWKVTSGTNKSAAVNKAKQTMFQHVRPATKNKIINGHSPRVRSTASSCSTSIDSLPFILFESGGSNDCSGPSNL